MCGIVGFNFENEALGRQMAGRLAHRGPDDEGVFSDARVTLGNRRLAVIDLSSEGHQPMSNDEKTVWVAYNGEIYNFDEIRADLLKKGFHFRSNTDTEVILRGYEAYGEDIVQKLRGMWAFAVYDAPKGKLFLSRDFFGIKPLYYSWDGTYFGFASEMKALRHFCEAIRRPLTLSREAASRYFVLGYVPHPYSIFSEVRKVEPGEIITIDLEKKTMESRTLEWDGGRAEISPEHAAENLEAVLLESVEKHLIADVPVGLFLSGGVDSTLLALLLKRLGKKLTTFTVRIRGRSDADSARAIAEFANLPHQEVVLDEAAMDEMYDKAWSALDEPFADSSIFPSMLVSRAAAKEVKVVMTGEGGDELFWGYNRYRSLYGLTGIHAPKRPSDSPPAAHSKAYLDFMRPVARRLTQMKRRFANDFMNSYIDLVAIDSGFWDHVPVASDLAKRYARNTMPDVSFFDRKLYLPDDLLYKTDTATMAYSIEGRVPLLDKKVYEFANALSADKKYSGGVGKKILKEYVSQHVPSSLAFRPKEGFSIPVRGYVLERHPDDVLRALEYVLAMRLPGAPAAAYQRILKDEAYREYIAKKFPALLFSALSFYNVMKKY